MLTSCNSEVDTKIDVTGVTISEKSLSLTVGGYHILTATVEPAGATNRNVTWESDKSAIAEVDAEGMVFAKAEGTARIFVYTVDGDKMGKCDLTVSKAIIPVMGVSLSKTEISFDNTGKTEILKVTLIPADATDQTVTWSSDDETVATITSNGTAIISGAVTAKGSGEANITVETSDGGFVETCRVTVAKNWQTWDETGQDKTLALRHGIPAYEETNTVYRRDGNPLLNVEMRTPVVVAVAPRAYGWGPFQFPTIYRSINNQLVAKWATGADHPSSYGKELEDFKLSSDNGKTWYSSNQPAPLYGIGYNNSGALFLPATGEHISIHTPAALNRNDLKMPQSVGSFTEPSGTIYTFYRLNELPAALQGVYLNRWDKNGVHSEAHAGLEDPGATRYSFNNGLCPVVWWGDMKLLPDNSIVAGVYPSFYERQNGGGVILPSGVSFYRSTDNGMNWKILAKIPYESNYNIPWAFGFTEPAFEILSDGTFLCVMRVEALPMHLTRSSDRGVTWSKPEAFVPLGVLPRLLQLENGVLVLASGRPGVQIRFSLDGKGEKWTDPFEMVPFGSGDVSCGYTGLLATGPDRFVVIYTDFKYPNQNNELRKAVKVREIVVTKK